MTTSSHDDSLGLLQRRVMNVVGHALRTPVTTLSGMARELSLADDPILRATLAAGVERNAAVVERLLDDLLLASGVTTSLPVGEPRPVDVAATVREAWTAVGGGDLAVAMPDDVAMVARPGTLERVLTAVLDNARKYADGGARVDIADGPPGRIAVVVTAPGQVPDAAELPLLFEPFYRTEHAVMRTAGMGVGLTVAQVLAAHDGGDVTVERTDGAVVTRVELRSP